MYTKTATLVVLVLAVCVAPGTTPAQSEAYAGTHVTFATEGDAVVDYAVDGTTVVVALAGPEVAVDGEAAAEASSYGELRGAADGGENSVFMVTGESGASASADVLVAVNHFSTREVATTEAGSNGDGGSGDRGSGDGESKGVPGFGLVGALLARVAAVGLARWRRPQ